MTLKDEKGGIAVVLVDESFNVRDLKVGSPNQAPVQKIQSRFTVAQSHSAPEGIHTPPMKPGEYSAFVSIGRADGTPQIALPITGDDGQRRYRLGTIQVAAPAK